ncbi:methyltransferase domain-containing protein [archaeon]|nr:methyltransferase domain-containing protein [archaeon]MBL7057251.1 methyltransferase domain-containing protein [Candidatus Woesearchaeota archaeon]
MGKKLLIKKERKVNTGDRDIVVSKFEKHLIDDNNNFGTQFGIIKKADLKKNKVKVGKEEFYILEPVFLDYYKRIKRLAQIITLKDIGIIISNTGMTRDSVVLEAGTGSAGLSCFLANIVKKVVSYDLNKEHQAVAEENIKDLGIKNIDLKQGDIFKGIKEKDFDIMVLDVTEPWKAIKTVEKALKKGGFLVSYSPNINQVQRFVKSLSDKFLYERTIEVIEREWTVKDLILRPKMKDIGHTAFLTFVRLIK